MLAVDVSADVPGIVAVEAAAGAVAVAKMPVTIVLPLL